MSGRGLNIAGVLPPWFACRPDAVLAAPSVGLRQNLIAAALLLDQFVKLHLQPLLLPAEGGPLVGLKEGAAAVVSRFTLTEHPGQHFLPYPAGGPFLPQQLEVRWDTQLQWKCLSHAHCEAVQGADVQPVQALQQPPQNLQKFTLASVPFLDQLRRPQCRLRR